MAEADASFRLGKGHQDSKKLIADIVSKGKKDARKEVAFLKEERSQANAEILKEQAKRIESVVEYILDRIG